MEPLKDPISVRVARINAEIVGKSKNHNLLSRETLLDALQIFYNECNIDGLQMVDSNIAQFINKYKCNMKDLETLRVNISDFEIKNLIGCGHFGEVHVVKEKQTDDIYAMKTIKKFDNDIKRMSFTEERDIMAYSNSHWLTSLQYSFQDSSYLFYVMDFHPGGDLLGLLYRKGGTLPESAALFYLAELLMALEDLHAMGYVHRDIKPDNILLDRCGHIKLADFGSAARLNKNGKVKAGGLPVGTPDYIAPEVLQCLDNKNEKEAEGYGVYCDYWSMGVLAFELTVGNPPFHDQNASRTYSKIMNFQKSLKFPSDILLTHGYVSLIKGLITDINSRLNVSQIKSHSAFRNTNFETLRDQIPPYVPKINSLEDTSNFTDVQAKKKHPSIENFKRRSQFSGKNLPFIGFTFTHDPQGIYESNFQRCSLQKSEIVDNLNTEIATLRMALSKSGDFNQEKELLEKKVEDTMFKLQSLETLRDKLEKQLADSIAESTAVKRTLEIERKERTNLEKRALDLIKGAKQKWEQSEKNKVEEFNLEIRQFKSKIEQLDHMNKMLNEQLKHAVKMDEKNRESLETEQKLSRKSVMGLENLLGKVTTDRQNRIEELQSQLNEEISSNANLRNEVTQLETLLEKNEIELKETKKSFKKTKKDHELLQTNLQDNENLVKNLCSKVNDLEHSLHRIDEYEDEIVALKDQIDDNQKIIKDLQNKCILSQNEIDLLNVYKKDNGELKEKMNEIMQNVSDLGKELEQKREQCKNLQKRLEDAEAVESKSQEIKEKQIQFYKMQKDLSNCQIDKRILERELKEAKAEIKDLQDKLTNAEKTISDKKKSNDIAILELSNINETVTIELVKSKESIKNLQEQLKNEKSKFDEEKTIINELKSILNNKEISIKNLDKQILNLQADLKNLDSVLKKEEVEKTKLMNLIEQLQKEKCTVNESLEKGKVEITNLKLNLDALREACTLLESQVVEYEKLVEISKAKHAELDLNAEKLIADLCKARQDTQEAKRQINEEKSLRAMSELKIKRLQEDVDCLEKESVDYKGQCKDYKEYSSNLSNELTLAEEKLINTESLAKSYERKFEKLSYENKSLKEEITDYITNIAQLKDSKYKLSHQVDDLKKNRQNLVQKLQELEGIHNAKMHFYKEREMKSEETNKQQLKLVYYLQSQIEELKLKKNPKKTLTEALFGSSKKENLPPVSQNHHGQNNNYRELENELSREKENNYKLQEEIFKLKAIASCEATSNVSEKINKMGKSKSEILPAFNNIESLQNDKHQKRTSVYEEWIKTPCTKTNSWVKRYARLTNISLDIYSKSMNENDSTLLESFPLKSKDAYGKVILEPLESEIGISVASNDLPFIMKIEIRSEAESFTSRHFILMALSAKAKDNWFTALQQLFASNQVGDKLESLIKLPENLTVNNLVELSDNLILLATDKGLYSIYDRNLHHIEGISNVEHVSLFHPAKVILMIVGSKSILISSDMNHLMNLVQCSSSACTKISLKYNAVNVSNLNGFHKLEVSKYSVQKKIAVATSKQLLILEYFYENNEFLPVRILDTAQPTMCMLFTENSLIVGADKFFEIDLNSFQAEEFLDGSDVHLKQSFDCYKLGSFPISILEISKNPKEYLVTFNEFVVFVDEYGRSSRGKELKNQHLPMAMHLAKNLLYIIQFSAVEILKITSETFADASTIPSSKSHRFELFRFKYLGGNSKGIFLDQDHEIKFFNARNLPDFDTISCCTETETNDGSDDFSQFSFSSSIVQSLDGQLNDFDQIDDCKSKKQEVKFDQTDF